MAAEQLHDRARKLMDELKRKTGTTQSKVAAEIGCEPPYLADILNGRKTNPSRELLEKLANKLGVDADWLLAGSHPVLREDAPDYRHEASILTTAPLPVEGLQRETLERNIVDLAKHLLGNQSNDRPYTILNLKACVEELLRRDRASLNQTPVSSLSSPESSSKH